MIIDISKPRQNDCKNTEYFYSLFKDNKILFRAENYESNIIASTKFRQEKMEIFLLNMEYFLHRFQEYTGDKNDAQKQMHVRCNKILSWSWKHNKRKEFTIYEGFLKSFNSFWILATFRDKNTEERKYEEAIIKMLKIHAKSELEYVKDFQNK